MLPEQMDKMARADQNLASAIREMTTNLAGDASTESNVADGLYAISASVDRFARKMEKSIASSVEKLEQLVASMKK